MINILNMTVLPQKGEREFVRVICDYTYKDEKSDATVNLKIGEEYLLISRVNDNWWYVLKKDLKEPFYVPAKYVEPFRKDSQDAEGSRKTSAAGNDPATGSRKPSASGNDTATGSRKPSATENDASAGSRKSSAVGNDFLAGSRKSATLGSDTIGNRKSSAPGSDTTLGGRKLSDSANEPSAKVKPAPKPRRQMSKTLSEDEALKELDTVLDSADPVQPVENKDAVESPRSVQTSENDLNPVKETEKPASSPKAADKLKPLSIINETSSPAPSSPISPGLPTPGKVDDETIYINADAYRQMVKDRLTNVTNENPAESETSDYRSGDSKGGSRESLDSDSQGKSCDTDSMGAKEELDVMPPVEATAKHRAEPPLPSKPATSKVSCRSVSDSSSDYANLADIQKVIHGTRSKAADVADGRNSTLGVPHVDVPPGWKLEVENEEKTFVNPANGEKWRMANDEKGAQYFYNVLTKKAVWNLNEVHAKPKYSRVQSFSAEEITTPPMFLDVDPNISLVPGTLAHTVLSDLGYCSKAPDGATAAAAAATGAAAGPSSEDSSEPVFDFPSLAPLPLKMVQKQGQLSKVKVDEGKKSKKLSWSQSYAVLSENSLQLFKDQKSATGAKPKSVSSLGKPEAILNLNDATLSSSPDEKKKEILVLRMSNGIVYFLHNENEEVLLHWKQSIQNNIDVSATMSSKEPHTKEGEVVNWKPEAIFGSSLKAICDREKSKIPRFVHECLVAVEKRGLDVDGIYRVSGNMAMVQKLRQMVDQNEFYDLNDPVWDVHTVTGALKLFFRELSEPLFTFALFEQFLSAYKLSDRTQRIKALRDVIKKLPPVHAETMRELFKHLTDVIRHHTVNRMQPQALAIVFGPTLLWPESKNKDVTLAASMVYQGQVVEFLIIEFKAIFSH